MVAIRADAREVPVQLAMSAKGQKGTSYPRAKKDRLAAVIPKPDQDFD
jgi:hypothetical protein